MIQSKPKAAADVTLPQEGYVELFIGEDGSVKTKNDLGEVVEATPGIKDPNKIYFADYLPKGDDSEEDSVKLVQALEDSAENNKTLVLPSGTWHLRKACKGLLRIEGALDGSTIIKIDTIDKSATFANQFALTNPHFTNGAYNPNTADEVYIRNVYFDVEPTQNVSPLGLANCKKVRIYSSNLIARKVVNEVTGHPFRCDALIDIYASCKNVRIYDSDLYNITGGRGTAYPWAEGGGGCIWVRNLLSSAALGADAANATEDVRIINCNLVHQTSDEAIAVYGVVGLTRNVKMIGGSVTGLPQTADTPVTHNTLVSAFPLKHSTLGANAAVEDVEFRGVKITDSSWMYSVARVGNTPDGTNLCRQVRFIDCDITAHRITTSGLSPRELWVAAGSPGLDPDINSLAVRAVQVGGSFGSYKDAGFEFLNSSVLCTGGTSQWAISGFDKVSSPTVRGSAWYAVAYVTECEGGDLEASSSIYYNVQNVVGGSVKVNISSAGSTVQLVDATSGRFSMSNVSGTSAGSVSRVAAAGTANTYVKSIGNGIGMTRVESYAMVNQSSTSELRSFLNTVTGTMAGGTSGDVESSLNRYGSTTD